MEQKYRIKGEWGKLFRMIRCILGPELTHKMHYLSKSCENLLKKTLFSTVRLTFTSVETLPWKVYLEFSPELFFKIFKYCYNLQKLFSILL